MAFEKAINQSACKDLGVKGIAISLPGVGNTDMKIGRKELWASEDTTVLDEENIDTFMITGHSQGTPHAMSALIILKKESQVLIKRTITT